MSSANPANPLTRTEFYNACTSVLQGIICLQRQGTIVNQDGVDTLDKLGMLVTNLRAGVQTNKEFYIDGPLVRFLTAQVSRGKTVIQEMKRTCSPQSSRVNGQDYLERHLVQHIADIKSVIGELQPYHNDGVFNEGTARLEQGLKERLPSSQHPASTMSPTSILKNGQTPPSRRSEKIRFDDMETVDRPAAQRTETEASSLPPGSAVSQGGDPPDGKRPGVFGHMNEVKNIYPKHSPNWPPYEDKPPLLMERTKPPLVHNGLRDVHNYNNLPQYTGVDLPMGTMPAGEFGHRAPHTQHWDYHNNRMY